MPLPNLKELIQKANEMKKQMQEAQKNISAIHLTGEAGGGLVKIHMNGAHQILRVEIAPELLKEDRDMLEDLVAAACNDAVQKIDAASQEQMRLITKGIELPKDLMSDIET